LLLRRYLARDVIFLSFMDNAYCLPDYGDILCSCLLYVQVCCVYISRLARDVIFLTFMDNLYLFYTCITENLLFSAAAAEKMFGLAELAG